MTTLGNEETSTSQSNEQNGFPMPDGNRDQSIDGEGRPAKPRGPIYR